jgi:hypothetical protein
VTYHGVESCGLDRGDVAGHGSFCAPCGRTTATANCRSGSGLTHSARPSARAAICAFRPKTLASGPTPLSGRRPIGHQVRFSPLGVPESLKSSDIMRCSSSPLDLKGPQIMGAFEAFVRDNPALAERPMARRWRRRLGRRSRATRKEPSEP